MVELAAGQMTAAGARFQALQIVSVATFALPSPGFVVEESGSRLSGNDDLLLMWPTIGRLAPTIRQTRCHPALRSESVCLRGRKRSV